MKKRKIGNIIKQIKPDLVISSLHYSLGVKTYKRIYNKCTYVQVLHGFSCPINGKLKANMVNKSIRRASKYFDHNVAVSYLTYSINKKINNTLCDAIIHNGCNFSPEKLINRDKDRLYDFVYVGRLYKDKEIESISEAFINAKKRSPNLKFAVAGYGELENLFVNGKYKCEEIDFLGKLSQEQVENLFKSSKFFVSLNPLEPFGIVFAEAVVNGCNIVTQSTCGFSYLFGKKITFIMQTIYHLVNCLICS